MWLAVILNIEIIKCMSRLNILVGSFFKQNFISKIILNETDTTYKDCIKVISPLSDTKTHPGLDGFSWKGYGNKTIRIIYQGANANATGSGTQIGTKAFNNAADYSEYVGFKYTLNKPNGTDTNSTILGENTTNDTTTLNGWYRVYLLEYETYIDKNTGFCGDRNIAYGTGMGTTETYYIGHYRITAENSPSLLCNNQDVYTTTDSNTGNQSLTYPIGLITADEVALAGGQQSSGDNFYLATGQDYWTMTPDFYPSHAIVFRISSVGYIDNNESVSETSGVRPVINLSADVTISSGNGTSSNPYVIAT